jgi:nucleoid-associated protein YgaU
LVEKVKKIGAKASLPNKAKASLPNKTSKLTLETIDYDDNDSLIFSGAASPDGVLQIYINDESVGSIAANQDGNWTLQINRKMSPAQYQIRIDQVTVNGKVIARIQVPFTKAPLIVNKNEKRTVIIEPGNSLWRIAARVYGSGFRYTEIYKANVDQIRDPDLIYPGQVFTLPKVN